ncbi:MAG TPA: alpha-1,4-glucan--maltose-1-phosphate maltosyltransferase [Terriglobales bacterium]|nr:alpha-1,4-glucan--maltose-1-phosphate maltosyltransferase [Terriglobales bacterium]
MRPASTTFSEGRNRVVIEGVAPEIDGGRFPIKRIAGEAVRVEADVFGDGHDAISCALLYRREGEKKSHTVPMTFLQNDRWYGIFTVEQLGRYLYTIAAWIDPFKSWRRDLRKRVEAEQHTELDLLTGALLIEAASQRSSGENSKRLQAWARLLREKNHVIEDKLGEALSDELAALMENYPDTKFATRYAKELPVVVEREKARFSAWYELFPRSCADEPGRHGTFRDCERCLPYIASMGFDTLYLPPIHPIGRTYRKGRNNQIEAGADDPGSPWAIGAAGGGHKSIHPDLGTLDDFRRLVRKAETLHIEIALDLAFQCSPDHPYVEQHPNWFRWRPDGTIQYAENPPKKYQDIFPLDFTTSGWQELWQELKSIVDFWIAQGVRSFRVDNPHTKPLPFWEWLIGEVKKEYPEVLFLAEAFTRPKVMYRLAKLGFSQSYTYFAWRNTKEELTEYFRELTETEVSEYFRPNLWPNTPDILTEYLQFGGRPAFLARLVLASTLGANYGIYGPAFELLEHQAREPGSEEYLDSEKYQIKRWNPTNPDSLRELITRINRIRRENPALRSDRSRYFHNVDNEQIIAYSKQTEDSANIILAVVNLDPHHRQSGWLDLDLDRLQLGARDSFQAHDLLTGARFLWQGRRNYVELNPQVAPAHIFRLRRRVRREQDFDYFN